MDGKMSDGYIVKETGWRVRERASQNRAIKVRKERI